jgi:hypothetical protein
MRQAIAQKVSDTTGEFELRYRRHYHSPESPHYQEGGANTHRSRSDALTAGGRQPAVRGANTTVRVVTPCAGWTVMPPMSAEPDGPDNNTAYAACSKAGCR